MPRANQDGSAGASSQSAGCSAGVGAASQQTGYHQGKKDSVSVLLLEDTGVGMWTD